MPYLSGVPSLSFAGVISSPYDLADSTFPPCSALSHVTMSPAVEQSEPAEKGQVCTLVGARRTMPFCTMSPCARRGMVTAATLAWARAMGEFGPILVFAGATRMRTEVMPTTVFLELSVGNLEPALAVSLLMVALSIGVLVLVRVAGEGGSMHDRV